jgi:transcriptional regulator with XRE-family HTH domain
MADDELLFQKRQGWWLRMARERAGKSQAGAAEVAGLSKNSKSSISDYENGVTAVPQPVLRRLARWYGVPVRMFTEPQLTAEEILDGAVRDAAELERADWESGEGNSPKADVEPAA